ncbi:MAG: hypothetical protein E7Z88_08560 [Cyanobacteria bacterium SIG27]|nr:hypothetical protein [Cyanobacteria bacterium SIG27]
MGISSINQIMSGSYGAYSQKLTQKTREVLEQLGIPYNSNMSESEARMLIKSRANQESKNAKEENFAGQNGSNFLFKKAVKLAQELGIAVNENVDFKALLSMIEMEIQNKLNATRGNIDELNRLKGLSQELAFIQAQSMGSSGYNNTNQALMMSLEMLGEYNKNFLNK